MNPARAGHAWLARLVLALGLLLLLGGCSTPQVSALAEDWPRDIPPRVQLNRVPFFAQEEYECGPAALAMAMSAAGIRVTPAELVEQVYLPGRKGSLQADMLGAARRRGLPAHVLEPRLASVLREVAAGHPVIVFQNLSLALYPVWHYAVVVGYDRSANTVTLHSGTTARLNMSLYTFERTWARGDFWAMLALPPSRLPATADADSYAASVARLELADPEAARVAYGTALKRWPDHRVLMLGAGNAAYTAGAKAVAAQRYQAAVKAHPDFADAWNNLAQTLTDLGRRREARVAIAHAVRLGGPRLATYQELELALADGGS